MVRYLNIIEEIHPKFFIMENVGGLLSAKLKDVPEEVSEYKEIKDTEGSVLYFLKNEFEKYGYTISFALFNSANYGVPQKRERVIIFGHRGKERISLPRPTHSEKGDILGTLPWKTLGEALGGLPPLKEGECGKLQKKQLKYLPYLKEGENWKNLPDDVVEEAMGASYKLGGGKKGFYRRLSFSQPSPTLLTSPIMQATLLAHPTELRPLSIREYARIQEFPDDWKLEGSLTEMYKQIGNATPVGLGYTAGKQVIDFYKKKEVFLERDDKFYLNEFFKKIKVDKNKIYRSVLLAEIVETLDNFFKLTEKDFNDLKWSDKKGKLVPFFNDDPKKSKEIVSELIKKRDEEIHAIKNIDEKKSKLKDTLDMNYNEKMYQEILKHFEFRRRKSIVEILKENNSSFEILCINASDDLNNFFDEKQDITCGESKLLESACQIDNGVIYFIEFIVRADKNLGIEEIAETLTNIEILFKALNLFLKLKYNSELTDDFKNTMIKNWFSITKGKETVSNLFYEEYGKEIELENFDRIIASDSFIFKVFCLYLEEINKLYYRSPRKNTIFELTENSVATSNPFLYKPLFSNYLDATEFFGTGKLTSSLEGKFGNLFEKLLNSYKNTQEINNGGIDCTLEGIAYDIKSGPNVMNKDQVHSFSIKKRLIEEEKLIKSWKTCKVALGYGKKEQLNSFMSKISDDILCGRETWVTLTKKNNSPELFFEVSNMICKLFDTSSIIELILKGVDSKSCYCEKDMEEFKKAFYNSFDEIELSEDEMEEIANVKEIIK